MTAATVTPVSALALEDTTMTPTRVATSTSKLWDTSWFNKFCNTQKEPSNGLKMQLRNCLF